MRSSGIYFNMDDNFDKAVTFTLKWEGYKSNHISDPGGLTIFGISSKYWPKEVAEMDKLSQTEACGIAKKIYKSNYWDIAKCSELPYPMDIVVFDTAVNCGVSRAIKFGALTLNWTDYLFNRLEYYNSLRRPIFMAGWTNRVIDLYRYVKQT